MALSEKKLNIEDLALKLLTERSEISLRDLGNALGLSSPSEGERKAIRRVLISLMDQGILQAKGVARARVYIKNSVEKTSIESDLFKNIPLSKKSQSLLRYVSQALQSRAPVGYQQKFLRSYFPNRTFYLSESERLELLSMGRVENRVRPAGTYARKILSRLLIDLSWNSSRLEGNTYSLLETKRLIELGENAAGKNASEAQMILNHKAAIEYMVESAAEGKINSHFVCSIHALLSENLLGDSSASGRIRQIAVSVGGTTYLPLENPHVLKECFQVFISKLNQIKDPFEQSFFALVHLSYLQAFEDINKRTARLVANFPFIKKNLIPLSFMDVNQEVYIKSLLGIYEKNDLSLFRDLYLWAYKRSALRVSAIQEAMGEPDELKLKYRSLIHEIIRKIILEKIEGNKVANTIQKLIRAEKLPKPVSLDLFKAIETEILCLHEGNIARFKVRPSEFEAWRKRQ